MWIFGDKPEHRVYSVWMKKLHNALKSGTTNFEAKVCAICLISNANQKPEFFAYEI